MQRRQLGSGFEIATIGLVSWAIGGHIWGDRGHSEDVVGRAVKQLPASRRPLIFTKLALGVDSQAPTRSAPATDVAAECGSSLRRLGVDRIDLYQLHWPAPQPIAETATPCHALLKRGKISTPCGVGGYLSIAPMTGRIQPSC
jgi:aryl-alcohol dehydrogenase-like predicted oxidoreductase